ncbi:hypothetical protein QYM36_005737 [Artemia franciscana]|uniref:Ig-like domain-containing protein n=1 Tax=Artemia franciscana TaxID=6661 RepID=A0AA88I056_ARTSF|nr:hypothetical protein QYM36_005737 [Artemia franciscana]
MHGPPEVYLKQGSVFLLTCTVAQVADGTVVFWYKDGEAVDISGRNIRVDTNLEKSGPLISRLQVQQALVGDSGNYTCAPTGSISASTMVHIINGEHPAAMQHGNVARSQDNFPVLFLLLVSLFLNPRRSQYTALSFAFSASRAEREVTTHDALVTAVVTTHCCDDAHDALVASQAPSVNPDFSLLSPTGHKEGKKFIFVDKKSLLALESSIRVTLKMLLYNHLMLDTFIKILKAENVSPVTIPKLMKLLESFKRCEQHLSNILSGFCSNLMLMRWDNVLKYIPD